MSKILQVLVVGLLSTVAFSLPLETNQAARNGKIFIKCINKWDHSNWTDQILVSKVFGSKNGDLVEGDMLLTDEQKEDLFSPARNGLIKTKYRWPNKTAIPFDFNPNHSKEQNDHIKLALKTIESVSCVRFVERTTEQEYISIMVTKSARKWFWRIFSWVYASIL